MEVPTKQEFDLVIKELRICQQEIVFLKSLLTAQRWLSRDQTLLALQVSKTTLWKLTKSGRLVYRKERRKISYDVYGLRAYLTATKIDAWHAEQRILNAILG